ncbi:MAG: M13 family metallopeptidase [Clostridium sp.]|nr:M13 family metallopeptidase [Prevotella sp.]MCM1429177.1 M13 family metallopeptidase [Clostridium sp.]
MNLKSIMLGAVVSAPVMFASATGHGIDRVNLDPATPPAVDFYQYACGGWMKNNPIPAEFARFGTFDQLSENARQQLKGLILNLSENPESKVKGSNAQKVCDIYMMGMDSVRLNNEGAAPLHPFLNRIKNSQREDLFRTIAWIHNGITTTLFSAGVGSDPKNSDRNIMHIGETGLGLGDRDYYLEDNETNKKIMEAYERYVKRIMTLAGYSPKEAERVWKTVIKIEKGFAEHKMTREQRRQPALRYNMMTIQQIKDRYHNIDWDTFFAELGVKDLESANVSSPAFLDYLNELLPALTDQELKDFFAYEVIADSTGLLSDDFYDASFDLYSRVMSGKEEQQPRWKRAMAIPNSMFGEAVGQLYVEKFFPEANKQYMKELVENLRVALGQHIDSLTWMSPETKQRAHDKLATFKVKIGYPDKWKDYSGIYIDPSLTYLENVYNASKWYSQDNYSKLSKPVDKTEWHMTPQTVNAYYSPSSNEICFPAAILQKPYFDLEADDALNYGAIGVVIGHEMTHGFDDQGRQYDPHGNLVDWWTEADAAEFNKLADRLVEQFNQVEVSPGVFANGRFTLGENIADQGGLRVAMTAYQNSRKGTEPTVIDGFTPEQRFYLAYANLWANNIRDEEILSLTKTDSHSLGRNRVNVSVRNLQPFFEAFEIGEGDPMFRPVDERVIIW